MATSTATGEVWINDGKGRFTDVTKSAGLALEMYGLGAAVWSREQNVCHRMARAIQSGRVWVNAYHLYPAHAAFGGYKQSGIGREGGVSGLLAACSAAWTVAPTPGAIASTRACAT